VLAEIAAAFGMCDLARSEAAITVTLQGPDLRARACG
jgi:hypothetical protein